MKVRFIRRALIAGLLLALGAVAAACGGGGDGGGGSPNDGSGGSDEMRIRALVEEAVEQIADRDIRGIYERLSPLTREQCSYERFLDRFSGDLALFDLLVGDSGKAGVRDIQVEILGDSALVSSILTIDGRDQSATEDDLVVKVDGEWYDVDEDERYCPYTGEGSASSGATRPLPESLRDGESALNDG